MERSAKKGINLLSQMDMGFLFRKGKERNKPGASHEVYTKIHLKENKFFFNFNN